MRTGRSKKAFVAPLEVVGIPTLVPLMKDDKNHLYPKFEVIRNVF